MSALDQLRSLDTTKRAVTLFDEFKNFAFKGNVIDLAVGVIIGAAFGRIVESLVKHLLMPIIGLVLPGTDDLKSRAWEVGGQKVEYGAFLSEVITFVIVAIALFVFIQKFLKWVMRARQQEVATPKQTKDQELLMEIRDLLKSRPSLIGDTEKVTYDQTRADHQQGLA